MVNFALRLSSIHSSVLQLAGFVLGSLRSHQFSWSQVSHFSSFILLTVIIIIEFNIFLFFIPAKDTRGTSKASEQHSQERTKEEKKDERSGDRVWLSRLCKLLSMFVFHSSKTQLPCNLLVIGISPSPPLSSHDLLASFQFSSFSYEVQQDPKEQRGGWAAWSFKDLFWFKALSTMFSS